MTQAYRGALVLRPAPGDARTAARLTALGIPVERCPLFAVRPLAWTPPAAAHDALLLTSANAVRHAGPGLAALAHLPVLAVGEATGTAARAAGLTVALTGDTDAADLAVAAAGQGWRRPLHLAGEQRRALAGVDAIAVYASDALPVDAATVAGWRGQVALLHSARAAYRLAELVDAAGLLRTGIALAALSVAVAMAAGEGWAACAIAPDPNDAALVAAAAGLIDRAPGAADKHGR